MRKTCLEQVYQLALKDDRVFFIGSDLGEGTLQMFKDQLPRRFFMEGVSEAHVVGMASGLALEGKIVYVNTIGTFITRRCFEQIVLDVCLHNLPVRLIGNGGGLVYAPLGPTHLATDDIGILRTIPHMTIIAPADADEMKRLMPLTLDHPGPLYIRLAKGYDPIVTRDDVPFAIGAAMLMREGADALLITTGITLKLALEAANTLKDNGIEATVLHMPTVKPLDTEAILRHAATVGAVVTVEEHSRIGGLGSAVAEVLAEARLPEPKCFKRIGIPDTFADRYGSQASLLEYYAITSITSCSGTWTGSSSGSGASRSRRCTSIWASPRAATWGASTAMACCRAGPRPPDGWICPRKYCSGCFETPRTSASDPSPSSERARTR
jgi:transketolase